MSHPDLARVQQWLRDHEGELLTDTQAMLRIPSVEESPEPNAPYGKPIREALDLALGTAQRWGMRTADLEGHIGYAEIGEGEKMILCLGHLDVVPVGAGWKHEPFGAEIADGYLYARGTTDDKGPTMAAFYAIRAIQQCGVALPARLRIAFGCNEESGFRCVLRYMKTEEAPTYGVAPDAMWPLCHAEKGISNLTVEVTPPEGEFALVEAAGGQRPNIVIDACDATVRVGASLRAQVEGKLADAWDRNVTARWEGDLLHLHAIGKAAHGASPYSGDSAAIRLFRLLLALSPTETGTFYEELFDAAHIGGAGLGIYGCDEVSHELTANLGIVETVDGKLRLLVNVRYPVTWKGDDVKRRCEAHLAELKSDWQLIASTDGPPLYFPLDHSLVRAIMEAVREETGEEMKPGTMGGGTYARAVPNTVAIGTAWEGDGHAHETDERVKVEHLAKMSRLYAHILLSLATLE